MLLSQSHGQMKLQTWIQWCDCILMSHAMLELIRAVMGPQANRSTGTMGQWDMDNWELDFNWQVVIEH